MITEFQTVLAQGGLVLWLMLALCIVLYTVLASTWLGLLGVQRALGRLLKDPPLQRMSRELLAGQMELFERDEFAWVKRRLPVISVLIALAPLSGLLGTVSGMLSTFSGMADPQGGKPLDAISSGISEALVTTQAGLFMAVPAAIAFALLKSKIEQVEGTLDQSLSRQIHQLLCPHS